MYIMLHKKQHMLLTAGELLLFVTEHSTLAVKEAHNEGQEGNRRRIETTGLVVIPAIHMKYYSVA